MTRRWFVTPLLRFSIVLISLHNRSIYQSETYNSYAFFLQLPMGNQQSVKHEPVSPYIYATSTTVPKKSALRRASSQPNVSEEDRTRYIPNMNKEKGLIMPTRPYGGKDASGVESPQWGWYASLTPPDMMYGSNKPKKQDVSGAPPMPQSAVTRIPEALEPKTNQVFQDLKKSQQPVGWTSVPI